MHSRTGRVAVHLAQAHMGAERRTQAYTGVHRHRKRDNGIKYVALGLPRG